MDNEHIDNAKLLGKYIALMSSIRAAYDALRGVQQHGDSHYVLQAAQDNRLVEQPSSEAVTAYQQDHRYICHYVSCFGDQQQKQMAELAHQTAAMLRGVRWPDRRTVEQVAMTYATANSFVLSSVA